MRSSQRLQMTSLAIFLFALIARVASGQTVEPANWQELRPEGEEFSILMPKDPLVEIGKMPYHKMELNTRLYLSHNPAATTFAVVSLSGIKSNPAMYSDLERLNSYVDAFKKLLFPKIASKETVTKFVMTGPKTLNGHKGREYQVSMGDRSGTAQVFATRRRFYGILFLAAKKSDAIRDQFLSSFILPEFVPKPAATATAQAAAEKAEAEVIEDEKEKQNENDKGQQDLNAANQASPPGSKGSEGKTGDANEPNPDAKTDTPNDAHPTGTTARKPISGGVLNGKALSLPLPSYPAEARAANASGAVTVQVTIDEWGTVTTAKVLSGHPLLQQAAVAAAFQARFSPTTLMGEPVKVVGVLVYNFTVQ